MSLHGQKILKRNDNGNFVIHLEEKFQAFHFL